MPKKPRSSLGFSKGEILREGKDVTLLCVGYMSYVALHAAELLSAQGVDCEVINARFIKPLDLELILNSLSKTQKLFTIEEGVVSGGFGSFVSESLIDKAQKKVIMETIGLPDRFIEHGDRDILLDKHGLSAEQIKEKVLLCLK